MLKLTAAPKPACAKTTHSHVGAEFIPHSFQQQLSFWQCRNLSAPLGGIEPDRLHLEQCRAPRHFEKMMCGGLWCLNLLNTRFSLFRLGQLSILFIP